jgi:kojibiose phosphorylase
MLQKEWLIAEDALLRERARYFETIFTLANGYLGVRGSSEEGAPEEHPGSYLAGVFDRCGDEPTELVNIPRWIGIRVSADGREISPRKGKLLAYRRYLDMQQALLVREFRTEQQRRTTNMRIERFVSRSHLHIAAIRYCITPENYSGRLVISSDLNADVTNSGRRHLRVTRVETFDVPPGSAGSLLETETLESKIRIAEAATTRLTSGGREVFAERVWIKEADSITEVLSFEAERGRQYIFEKLVVFFNTRDGTSDVSEAARTAMREAHQRGYAELFASHARNWADVWRWSDVRIEGDEPSERAVRFSVFHQIACAPLFSDKVSLAAKGLHGEGYRGHVFWDCEIFNLPMFIYTHPEIARNLLMYRYHTLPGARRKARSAGYRGAMYAWESADTGDEVTPLWGTDRLGQRVPILCGQIEQHISADVAYGVWQYWQATHDEDFLINYGAEIIFETARFWVSRFEYNQKKDHHEIRGVIGPDEYHEYVDNSVFTNAMAQWNIRLALDLAEDLKHRYPEKWAELKRRLRLTRLDRWRRIAEKVYIPFSHELGIHEQFDNYLKLERFDLSALDRDRTSVETMLGRERVHSSQIIKQADVVMLMFLLPEQFDKKQIEANFNYYAPICAHGSSLSPSVHAIVAARLGRSEEALRYFEQSAAIDLSDRMGNSEAGIHLASLGGNWQAVIRGICGVEASERALCFNPCLPARWQSVSFWLVYRGTPAKVTLKHHELVLDLTANCAGRNLPIEVRGVPRLVECGKVHTFPLDAPPASIEPVFAPEPQPVLA